MGFIENLFKIDLFLFEGSRVTKKVSTTAQICCRKAPLNYLAFAGI